MDLIKIWNYVVMGLGYLTIFLIVIGIIRGWKDKL